MPERVDRLDSARRRAARPTSTRSLASSRTRSRSARQRAGRGTQGTTGVYDAEIVPVPIAELAERRGPPRRRHAPGVAGEAQAVLPRRRHGDRRQRLAAGRRGRRAAARRRGRRRRARTSSRWLASPPPGSTPSTRSTSGSAPCEAVNRALAKAGKTPLPTSTTMELNEAFAAQSLACLVGVARPRPRDRQPARRRDRHRPPARLPPAPASPARSPTSSPAAGGWRRRRGPVHRRRPGHRPHPRPLTRRLWRADGCRPGDSGGPRGADPARLAGRGCRPGASGGPVDERRRPDGGSDDPVRMTDRPSSTCPARRLLPPAGRPALHAGFRPWAAGVPVTGSGRWSRRRWCAGSSRACTSPRRCPTPSLLRSRALQLVVPRDSVVTDWTACWFYTGVLPAGQHVDLPPLTVFRPAGHDRLRNTLCSSGERGLVADDLTHVGGLRITTPLRTAWDLGRLAHRDRAIGALGRTAAARFVHPGRARRRGRALQGHARRGPAAQPCAAGRRPVRVTRRVDAAPAMAGPPEPAPAHTAGPDHGGGRRGVPRGSRRAGAARYGCEYDGEEFHAVRDAQHDLRRRVGPAPTGSPGTSTRSGSTNVSGPTRDVERVLVEGIRRARRAFGGSTYLG